VKEKIYKLFLVLVVSLSLSSNPLFQNEMRKLLEALSGVDNTQVIQELDEEEKQKESEEIRKLKHRLEWNIFESEK
jgi:flagellar biosynthesis/type III secretory pathway M-ring protein FliF/YscJ